MGMFGFGAGYFGQGPAIAAGAAGPFPVADTIIQVRADDVVVRIREDDFVIQVRSDDRVVDP